MSAGSTDDRPALLDVVIVNWNTGDCLRACLRSLAVAGAGLRLGSTVVVDNASEDTSAADLPARPEVVLIRNSTNVGFATACNQGARLGTAPYLLFLNPDTVLLPNTLQSALDFMEGSGAAPYGICGGLVLQPDGTVAISASRFPTLANIVTGTLDLDRLFRRWLGPRHLSAHELTNSRPVDQVIGAFFLVRRSLFDRLGGFDERYFLYYEEVDFCRRAALVGEHAYLVTDATLYHIGNVSARRSGGRALFYSLRSRTIYAGRHWPLPNTLGLVAFTLILELPARFLRAALHRRSTEGRTVIYALADYVAFLVRSARLGSLVGGAATESRVGPTR